MTTSLPTSTGPQGASIWITQEQGGAGGIIGDLAGLEHIPLPGKTQNSDGIAGVKGDFLLAGKPGRPHFQGELAHVGGINDDALLVEGNYRTV